LVFQSFDLNPIICTNHRLTAMAAERDDESCQCGEEPDECINQQCEINRSHGFLLFRPP
jgi:hypothetical protein